jgi:hypothetical protein
MWSPWGASRAQAQSALDSKPGWRVLRRHCNNPHR